MKRRLAKENHYSQRYVRMFRRYIEKQNLCNHVFVGPNSIPYKDLKKELFYSADFKIIKYCLKCKLKITKVTLP